MTTIRLFALLLYIPLLHAYICVAQPNSSFNLINFSEDVRIQSNAEDLFGSDLAVGDFNGDGIADILVGAYTYSIRNEFRFGIGRAYIVFGDRAILPKIDLRNNKKVVVITGDDPRDSTGDSVGSGDVNGDGISDAIIGTLQLGHPIAKGRTYIIYGQKKWPDKIDLNTNGGPVEGVIRITGKQAGDMIGQISASGDVNGDGYDDVIIGAASASVEPDINKAGEIYILAGSDSLSALIDLNSQSPLSTIHSTAGWYIGLWAKCIDLNGDGYSDILLGDPGFSTADAPRRGAVGIIYGAPELAPNIYMDELTQMSTKGQLLYGESEDKFGYGFAAGDMNGNGQVDLVITSVQQNTYVLWDFSFDEQSINIHAYNPKLVLKLDGDYNKDLSTADFNRDGFSDLLVGSAYESVGPWRSGAVFVVYGTQNLPDVLDLRPDETPDQISAVLAYQDGQLLGHSVTSGDINGDGTDDVLVGAPGTRTLSGHGSGEVYIIYGRSANTPVTVFEKAQLLQSFPNPFNANTIIRYQLERSQQIRMAIYNARGQKVRRLVDGVMPAGEHRAIWNGYDDSFNQAGSGVYFCRIGGETFNRSIKLLYLK